MMTMLFGLSQKLLRRYFNCGKSCLNVRKSHFYAIKLKNKRLIRVSGEQSFIYLQSLLTNDLRHLTNENQVEPKGCVYAFMLSSLGKVLADLFVYKGKLLSDGELIIEVDSYLANALRRLLIGYNIDRKITVEAVNDMDLWTLIPKSHDIHFIENNDYILKEVLSDDFKLVNDPRMSQMGYRLLTRIGGQKFDDIIKYIDDKRIEEGNIRDYRSYRYKLGVSEGYEDILSGFYFPFECNGDYLNAVSVDKGLYTSEEKTIKVYTNRAIFRRIMPIEFLCTQADLKKHNPPPSTQISGHGIKNLGNIRNRIGFNGIASLRVLSNETPLKYTNLVHTQSDLKMKTWFPEWWPHNVNQIYFPEVDYPQNLFNIIA